jgi:hypothetical protein
MSLKTIKTILLILCFNPIFGQNHLNISNHDILDKLISILKTDSLNFDELNLFWEKEINSNKKQTLEKRINFKRKIENDFIQENIELNVAGIYYDLNIITSNGSLVYLKLSEIKEKKTLLERIERVEFAKTDFEVYIYGLFFGITGAPPEKCQEMLSLVRDNNYSELANWLHTINPEKTVYGYVGITFLEQTGRIILPREIVRMDYLRKSDITLYFCEGCGLGFTKKISTALLKKDLKKYYRSFKKSGWLN